MKSLKRTKWIVVVALVTILTLTAHPASLQAPSAQEVMIVADNRFQGADFKAQVKLTTINPQGQATELLMKMQTKLWEKTQAAEEYRYKILARVLEPEDSRGLAVLVRENVWPKPDDIWLYLAALDSTKKIVPESFRTPVFGSEFTFEELTEREPMKDTHQLVRTEKIMGKEAWVIKSRSKTPAADGFSYRLTWVIVEWKLPVKMELYDSNDQLLKVFNTEEVEVIDGIPTRIKSTAKNLVTGRMSTFQFIDPNYDTGIPAHLFNPERLGEEIEGKKG